MEPKTIPQHVAVIMDGNGRWAKAKGLLRVQGHQKGIERVEEIIAAAAEAGVRYLTLYAFSKENWRRPEQEVNFLMDLLSGALDRKVEELHKKNVVFNAIGRLEDLPSSVREKLRSGMDLTRKNTGLVVTFALSYSSRLEMVDACRKIGKMIEAGTLKPGEVTEETISNQLYTAGMPDPDLLIRTSGEMRISNFLLWQISYAELFVTQKFWPDFGRDDFFAALDDFQKRDRRFGRTSSSPREQV